MDQSPFTADAPAETHLRLREGSEEVIRVLSVHVPLLEALPEYRGRGIGSELVRRMLEKLDDLYMVDLLTIPNSNDSTPRQVCGPRPG